MTCTIHMQHTFTSPILLPQSAQWWAPSRIPSSWHLRRTSWHCASWTPASASAACRTREGRTPPVPHPTAPSHPRWLSCFFAGSLRRPRCFLRARSMACGFRQETSYASRSSVHDPAQHSTAQSLALAGAPHTVLSSVDPGHCRPRGGRQGRVRGGLPAARRLQDEEQGHAAGAGGHADGMDAGAWARPRVAPLHPAASAKSLRVCCRVRRCDCTTPCSRRPRRGPASGLHDCVGICRPGVSTCPLPWPSRPHTGPPSLPWDFPRPSAPRQSPTPSSSALSHP